MTEHERRVHDKTIKAYEHYETDNAGLAKLGQNYSQIQNKYIGKAFGGLESPSKQRPDLSEVVTVS